MSYFCVKFGKIFANIFLFFLFPLLYFWDSNFPHVTLLNMVPQISVALCIFFNFFFSFSLCACFDECRFVKFKKDLAFCCVQLFLVLRFPFDSFILLKLSLYPLFTYFFCRIFNIFIIIFNPCLTTEWTVFLFLLITPLFIGNTLLFLNLSKNGLLLADHCTYIANSGYCYFPLKSVEFCSNG